MNEKYYIRRIQKGDHRALDHFIELLYPQVYCFICHKIKDENIAKDITQDTFVRFIRALPTYHSEGKVLNYLYKIASHVCYDYFKKEKNYLILEDELIADETIDVHETIIKNMTSTQLQEAIYELKPAMQDIIILKYYHQYTFKEISEIYHIPISTVKTRHYQALIQLKKQMEGEHIDEY